MAPISPSNRRPFNTRHQSARKSDSQIFFAESPSTHGTRSHKKRYVPGGPGGGGRYVDKDGAKLLVGGTGPSGYNYINPRGRVGRESITNGVQPVDYSRPRRESRRERAPARPQFSSAAAAAAAVVHGDGFKPREERGWEEFHQDLDIAAPFPVFSADDVDGVQKPSRNSPFEDRNDSPSLGDLGRQSTTEDAEVQTNGNYYDRDSATPGALDMTPRRRPGRPPRRTDSMLKGIGTPDVPKVVPLPGFNPREKLTLPKPSFRRVDPFIKYEQHEDYVDRYMANVGYQEGDIYIRPEKMLIRLTEGDIEEDLDLALGTKDQRENNAAIGSAGVGRVEYDMDEQDNHWLEMHNIQRNAEQVEAIKPAIFEIAMTKIEKEWHALEKSIPKPNPKPPQTHRPRSSSAAAVNGELGAPGEEQDSKCAICDDGDCENTNAIVFCDGCDLAVHQECYGVPFIPEGQWLCRKCQLIGRGTPTCIFCPNTDGAFKQTNASRWSHLLCAVWIPEVSIGNSTFMEPVMDVEKVPKPRWKLTCYICRQRMGACIQCGNKNCYIAFHVTCARRAKLFLKMKSTHGGPASLDASVLKAYCDKHVPADWRREHDVDHATLDAMEYYRYTMRGRLWADSQQSALTIAPASTQEVTVPESIEQPANPKITLNLNPNKRKRNQVPKVVWKLSPGVPVIPLAVYNSVESSLGRFSIRRRKDFAAEVCKYWTLKREARRGAALLKRLQLQMETFSSMEITRRNFVGMGAAGRVRLQRRIDFAEQLLDDVDKLRQLCERVKDREHEKLKDAEMLKDVVDTVYFPITTLLWPIWEKAQSLDGKGVFHEGFSGLRNKLSMRYYTTVAAFSTDFGAVMNSVLGLTHADDLTDVQTQINGEAVVGDLPPDYKAKKALANRIVKAVKGPLEDAVRKESELCRKPFEKELRELDLLLENSILSRRDSMLESPATEETAETTGQGCLAEGKILSGLDANDTLRENIISYGSEYAGNMDIDPAIKNASHRTHRTLETVENETGPTPSEEAVHRPTPDSIPSTKSHKLNEAQQRPASQQGSKEGHTIEPPTPPMSSGGEFQLLLQGGIPWYMEPFDPSGTTIEEERWTGREGMSEDLSDMDEEELSGLVGVDDVEGHRTSANSASQLQAKSVAKTSKTTTGRSRKKWRGFR